MNASQLHACVKFKLGGTVIKGDFKFAEMIGQKPSCHLISNILYIVLER